MACAIHQTVDLIKINCIDKIFNLNESLKNCVSGLVWSMDQEISVKSNYFSCNRVFTVHMKSVVEI